MNVTGFGQLKRFAVPHSMHPQNATVARAIPGNVLTTDDLGIRQTPPGLAPAGA